LHLEMRSTDQPETRCPVEGEKPWPHHLRADGPDTCSILKVFMRKTYIHSFCTIGIILSVALVMLMRKTTDTQPQPQHQEPQQQEPQPPAPQIRQDREFIESLFNGVELRHGMASDGLHTTGHVPIAEGQSILEVHFLKRNADGRLATLPLHGFVFEGRGFYEVNGATGLRMAIEIVSPSGMDTSIKRDPEYEDLRGSRIVVRDYEYHISGIMLLGESSTIFTSPLKPTFTVPGTLPPNSVFRVELVVLDEQLNKKLSDEKTRLQQQTREESITVNLMNADRGIGFAYYMEKTCEKPFDLEARKGIVNENSEILINGPNELGGELIVVGSMKGSGGIPFLWSHAYVRKLNKRSINIPEDADLVIQKQDMIPVTFAFHMTNALGSKQRVYLAFFEKNDSKLPLLIIWLHAIFQAQGNPCEFDFSIAPGSYTLKLCGHEGTVLWPDYLSLGTMEIKPGQTRYEVELPDAIEWPKLKE